MGRVQEQVAPLDKRCSYGKQASCTTCNYIVHRSCDKFVKLHKKFLLQELSPFNFAWDKTAKEYEKSPVVYCTGTRMESLARVKSNAVNWALSTNNRIMRIDTNQAMMRVLNPRRDETARVTDWWNLAKGFYLELSRKEFTNKDAEIMSVLEQFITTAVEEGCHVFMWTRYPLQGYNWIEV